MDFRKVTAIIRPDSLEKVEKELQALSIPGVSVTKVKGYGEYANFYAPDWMLTHVRVEVFIGQHYIYFSLMSSSQCLMIMLRHPLVKHSKGSSIKYSLIGLPVVVGLTPT